jgi:hypothetical protein
METVSRSWTIASWLLAGHGDDVVAIDRALDGLDADVVLVQSVRERDVVQLAAALGANHVWARSHHPRGRLSSRAVGLAVLTPHRITTARVDVISTARSTWSRHRRTAQTATVERADHSGYTFGHAAAPNDAPTVPTGGAPAVTVHPARIAADPARALDLPDGATIVSAAAHRPFDGEPLLVATFAMPWVRGDFPAV